MRPDFGVSAIQGAWVGAITATAWSRAGTDHRNRSLVAAGVCAVAGVGWWLHPDPSILTTEHLFAFLIGAGAVSHGDGWLLQRERPQAGGSFQRAGTERSTLGGGRPPEALRSHYLNGTVTGPGSRR